MIHRGTVVGIGVDFFDPSTAIAGSKRKLQARFIYILSLFLTKVALIQVV